MKYCIYSLIAIVLMIVNGCSRHQTSEQPVPDVVHLITLDPGHFHAALVQKTMYEGVDSVVHVYAPEGADVRFHLDRIEAYNNRDNDPTSWKQQVYTGADFLEKMLADKPGNVVVLAGNNQKKTEYIKRSLEAGLNVLADKPMAINGEDFELLKEAFAVAEQKGLLLYDIMTERFEITTMLQKELSLLPEVFGELRKGSIDEPAVTKESVHHFYKYVSGNVLTRPAWFMDVEQEGEGIVDVTTHLVDLVQWECFPNEIIDYEKDVEVISAKRWPTEITLDQFKEITKVDSFPSYLSKDVVNGNTLHIYANGEINYKLRDVHAKVSVTWAYKAPEGGGDTHYSIMRGSKANLIIRQGAEQNFKPSLFIEPMAEGPQYDDKLVESMTGLQAKYPGIELQKNTNGWEVVIPDSLREGHEAHFARVTENFLRYMEEGKLPAWEIPNMIAKYYTTTKAREFARKDAR